MKSLHIFIFLGLFSATTFAQTVTLPPYYGVQSKPDFICGVSTVTDYQGNVYNTVKIGDQCWLKENLRSTKYNDGTNIPNVTDNSTWANLTTPAYCWYNNDYATYGSVYGALYNWYTVDTEKLCPIGWHVPSDTEWTQLTDYLGGESVAGSKLKEAGTTHWNSPNTGATNESGFTALPAGNRSAIPIGEFININQYTFYWSSTQQDGNNAFFIYLMYNMVLSQTNNTNKVTGLSIRCLKD